ncbi:hypothetical protein PF002_g26975 [Phytophthora fragariae]|uniref:Uncharacterized protein n=1 Tax=Phytophthora fragariae TaxID=53985 RepID=A0A6A3WHR6_9STRA|nr:hypothetical protein PF003_g4885 [Phytophthora fragariae]KAE8922758.1 hypothetical protein PF009_g26981 [Phytophthora fragariae]KAE9072352.1 hypothetical protein PF007_g26208 [Phytophthora fragariae]KAE9088335.1 hypothetical protein PF006_g25604 [Phytophthora fragariae]KAE9182478.1 hypothetical protein PF002_g26975 [Phytophthora fragariae]
MMRMRLIKTQQLTLYKHRREHSPHLAAGAGTVGGDDVSTSKTTEQSTSQPHVEGQRYAVKAEYERTAVLQNSTSTSGEAEHHARRVDHVLRGRRRSAGWQAARVARSQVREGAEDTPGGTATVHPDGLAVPLPAPPWHQKSARTRFFQSTKAMRPVPLKLKEKRPQEDNDYLRGGA